MINSELISKSANEWISEEIGKPMLKMLFSEFWFENELCILFADTNLGKSILAVQIADSISKGVPVTNFKIESEPTKVLYLDCELSPKQFQIRYSQENTKPYLFHNDFIRAEFNRETEIYVDETDICNFLETEILTLQARIIIIDNITYLCNDNEKAKPALELMKKLKALKQKHSLSILILAHTPKREYNRPITNNDVTGSKQLINFCDSAFAIGSSSIGQNTRYIKQIKQRNCEQMYHQDNVCICEINKGKHKNFLQFEFKEYGKEMNHLTLTKDLEKDLKVADAKLLKSKGVTNKEIGVKYGVDESTIRQWTKD